jgi:hypothetical protein
MRFRAPQAPAKVPGVLNATTQPAQCFQSGEGISATSPFKKRFAPPPPTVTSEDCLFLKYVPAEFRLFTSLADWYPTQCACSHCSEPECRPSRSRVDTWRRVSDSLCAVVCAKLNHTYLATPMGTRAASLDKRLLETQIIIKFSFKYNTDLAHLVCISLCGVQRRLFMFFVTIGFLAGEAVKKDGALNAGLRELLILPRRLDFYTECEQLIRGSH